MEESLLHKNIFIFDLQPFKTFKRRKDLVESLKCSILYADVVVF